MQINPEPELSEVGGKAYQLNRLMQLCNVPPFFTVKFDSFDEINDPLNQAAIAAYCQSRSFTLVAVRSSANGEDSAEASFAGMFETVLNVRPSRVIEAIGQVLSSVNSQRLKDYCDALGIEHRQIRMAVVIQQMVRSRVSGVCFTKFRIGDNNLIIEACLGLGEALVSGKVTPDTYIVNREAGSVEKESIGYQKLFLAASDEVPATYREVPFFKRNARKLNDFEIRAITQNCILVERELEINPADIEWAYEEDVLYILQARPYTGLRL